MMCAIIDIGSNSIRLSVYRTQGQTYKRLFSNKSMAGLAGYVLHGALTASGIACACQVLKEYKAILGNFEIDRTAVFATASLRNISNTEEAVHTIEESSGFHIEVLSGYDEALFGYYGAQADCDFDLGTLIDIGGGSTEVVYFADREVKLAQSMPIGSLDLYTKHVSKLLPGTKECNRIRNLIKTTLNNENIGIFPHCESIYGVGGTARATVKLANRLNSLDSANRSITISHLNELRKVLCGHDGEAQNLILKTCPERIHTIIPGLLILDCIAKKLEAQRLTVSCCGVREGYLCQRIIAKHN